MLGLLVCASTALRAWAGSRVPTPWINADEVLYAELGRSLYGSGHFALLGQPVDFYSLVYPALIGLPLRLGDIELGYALAKLFQALVMSVAAVPVYLWGRAFMSRGWALYAAALTIAIPGLAYSGLLMSEVAFYPVMVLAAWAMAAALARPTFVHQALFLGAVALAVATRIQAIVLLPVFCTALVLTLVFDRGGVRRLGAFAPAFAGLALMASGWMAWRLSTGGPASELLGAYRAAGEVSYSAAEAFRLTVFHAADLLLLTVILPVCAVALLLVDAIRSRERSDDVRAYLAVTVALCLWLVVEVGVFASRHVGRLAERNLLATVPVLFLGFGLWLHRGARRPPFPTGLVALGTLLLVLVLPVGELVTPAAIPGSFSLAPLLSLRRHLPQANLDLLLLDVVGVALVLLMLVPRRFVWLLPLAVFATLVAGSVVASLEVATQATDVERRTLGAEKRWLDRTVDAPVTFVYSGDLFWTSVYENVFWNQDVRRIVLLPGFLIPGPIPRLPVAPKPDGTMVFDDPTTPRVRYVTASNSITFVGEKVVSARTAALTLWRVAPPFRMSTWLTGMAIDSTKTDSAAGLTASGVVDASRLRLAVYGCTGGVLQLTLSTNADGTAFQLRRTGRIVRTRVLRPWATWRGSLALPAASRDHQCEFDISTSALLQVKELRLVRDRS